MMAVKGGAGLVGDPSLPRAVTEPA